jgi:alpha-L-fucosidase
MGRVAQVFYLSGGNPAVFGNGALPPQQPYNLVLGSCLVKGLGPFPVMTFIKTSNNMKKYWLTFVCICLTRLLFAQTYQPTWESLDQRAVPAWFRDAKFGIFIHWGVYSVPAYAPKGNYAEWYQNWLVNKSFNGKVADYHQQKYGNTTYYQLADQFKAEFFDPEEWARLFEASGAKYIVLTSKHHDGFCLWPSKEADRDWGFPWNATAVGPKRDLIGDLFKAVRKTSVKPGLYYSLYEWYNPLWLHDKTKYVTEHEIPQMKDLIKQYRPYVLWTDGEWEMSAEKWKSKEFLAWLYNSSSMKDSIVVNDRWGSGVRFHHAGFYTPEYQPDLDFADHYWEESRGIGYSYGYNRVEDAWDYNSAQSLVLQLVDKVSRGGNFLLDIGPDADGKIPPIMQERLLEIGRWLKENGEAIYNTTRWRIPSQWTEGNTHYRPAAKEDPILKTTVDPQPGYAVRNAFFTYNEQTNTLYAILPRYPANGQISLQNITLPEGTSLSLLATGETLQWEKADTNTLVHLPPYDPNKIKAPYAYAIKIAHYGRYTRQPAIAVDYPKNSLQPTITLSGQKGAEIRYTTDGSEPTRESSLYKKPFSIKHPAVIKAIAFSGNALPSLLSQEKALAYDWVPAQEVPKLAPGITYQYFEPEGKCNLSVINDLVPKKTGTAETISVDEKERDEKFAFAFTGYIKINADGVYTFTLASDDGSQLLVDETMVIDNDGEHGPNEVSGKIALKKGYHAIKVLYFDAGGNNALNVYIQPQGQQRSALGSGQLFHAP